jgi:hypothetical protein
MMTNPAYEDMFNMICGDKLGEGAHRMVFEHKYDKGLVIKVEKEEPLRNFMNILENYTYSKVHPTARKWLAPVEGLSPDGRVSFQKRCVPLAYNDHLPDMIPSFLSDCKPSNFGYLDGRIVCFDYAIVHPMYSMRLVRVI